MCGIAGFAGSGLQREAASDRLRRMCDAIAHRGPDDAGYFVDGDVALGMRRLSIIDVAGGAQPIANEDGQVIVVFNGEIYNYRRLRDELASRGHVFRTRSDTEVLVHLYEDMGLEMPKALHGMFAFALWDARHRRLLLARDRAGIKPLSYRATRDGIEFYSELRSLFAIDSPAVSSAAILQYLAFGYVPEPLSVAVGVRKLGPGEALLWEAGRPERIWRYWEPPVPEEPRASESELVESMRQLLDRAVASHLESEVPLGAFLSGGLDSSLVVALMARHASGRVKTFTIGFDEAQFDESRAATDTARCLATDHTSLVLRPDAAMLTEAVAALFDEPFGDSSAIPTLLVAQLARGGVTVALSGDGGDELFGGYTRYRKLMGYRESGVRAGAILARIGYLLPPAAPGRNRLIDLGRTRLERYAAMVSLPLSLREGGVARRDVSGGDDGMRENLNRLLRRDLGEDVAATCMLIDFESYLPGDILTKVDRTSMAVSLEARVPLLDSGLVEFALRLPGRLRATRHESKRILRKAIRGIVPDAVLTRPKQGFEAPLGRWLRGPLLNRLEALSSEAGDLADFVDVGAVRRLAREHAVGRRDHSVQLWRLMILREWFRALRDGRLARPPVVPALPLASVMHHGLPRGSAGR